MADAKRAHRVDRFDEQRIAFDEDGERRAAVRRPGAALDHRVGAAGTHLRGEARPRRRRSTYHGATGSMLRRPPERLLGDVGARAVAGRQEDEARRVGRRPARGSALERLDAAAARAAAGGRATFARRRPDERRTRPRRSARRSCTRPCLSSASSAVGRVGRARRRPRRRSAASSTASAGPGTSCTAMPVSAPKACCRLRARPDSTRARSTPRRSGPARSAGFCARATRGAGRRRQAAATKRRRRRHRRIIAVRRRPTVDARSSGAALRPPVDRRSTPGPTTTDQRRDHARCRAETPTHESRSATRRIRSGQAPRSPLSRSAGRAAIARISFLRAFMTALPMNRFLALGSAAPTRPPMSATPS